MENTKEKILGVLQAIQKDIGGMKTDINNIKSTQQEHTQLLRALEHRTDVIKAEQENMKMSLARNKLSGGII
ncbi:MAG: hypothetical protein GX347_05085 [Epulopiscium sp.]|nr:hypothetical protein [Candidatus Epulonipiscium sp.]